MLVNVVGGDGFDMLCVIGMEFGDDFVINEMVVYGVGVMVYYGGLE